MDIAEIAVIIYRLKVYIVFKQVLLYGKDVFWDRDLKLCTSSC